MVSCQRAAVQNSARLIRVFDIVLVVTSNVCPYRSLFTVHSARTWCLLACSLITTVMAGVRETVVLVLTTTTEAAATRVIVYTSTASLRQCLSAGGDLRDALSHDTTGELGWYK